MVMIPNIQSSVEPQGQIETLRRQLASGEDFGAPQAGAAGLLSRGLGQASTELQNFNETQDTTQVYKNLAQARVDWTQELQRRATQAPAGSDALVTGLQNDMGNYATQGAQTYTTPKGQELWARLSAGLQAELGTEAIRQQGAIDGSAAINSFHETTKNLAVAAAQHPENVESLIAEGSRGIDDPTTIFGRPGITTSTRQAFKDQQEEAVAWAAAQSFTKDHPLAALAALSPSISKRYDIYTDLLQKGAAPGGNVDLKPETVASAPELFPVAARLGINPAIPLAMKDQGATQDLTQMATNFATLSGAYQQDVHAALAAYHDGTDSLDMAMTMYGSEWADHVSPEAATFAQEVMRKAGLVPGPAPMPGQAAPSEPQPAPVPLSGNIPGLNHLSADKQTAVGSLALEFANLQLNMDKRVQDEQKTQQKEAVSALRDQYEVATMNAKSTADFAANREKIINETGLASDPETRAWLFNFNNRMQDEKKAQANGNVNQGNPAEALQLMKEVQAADGNPIKVYSDDHARASFLRSGSGGGINYEQLATIQNAVARAKDGGTSTLQQTMNKALASVKDDFKSNPQLSVTPGAVAAASWNAYLGMEAGVKQAKDEGWNPMELFTQGSKHYFMSPENLTSFTVGAKQGFADQAAKVVDAGKLDRTPIPGYDIGKSYRINGQDLFYQGGPKNLSTSWGRTPPAVKAKAPETSGNAAIPTEENPNPLPYG